MQTVRYLLNGNMVEVNAVNEGGLTALDVVEHMPRDLKSMEIRESLSKVGALRARNVPANGEREIAMVIEESRLDSVAQHLDVSPRVSSPRAISRGISIKKRLENQEKWLKNKHEALMITAGVIAAMAYLAGLNPPGGNWQDDKSDHDAGTSIMGDYCPGDYRLFWIFNTVALVTSLSTIFLLISGIPMKKRVFMYILVVTMWVTITCMALAYLISLSVVSPDHQMAVIAKVISISVRIWLGLIGIVFLVHFVRFFIWCVRKVRKVKNKRTIKS